MEMSVTDNCTVFSDESDTHIYEYKQNTHSVCLRERETETCYFAWIINICFS